QRITCNDVGALRPGQAQYTALLTERGTFLDDCVVYRFDDRVMIVVNAANIAKDWEHVVAHKRGANVRLKNVSDETGLLAVQGPGAEALIAPLTPLGIAMIPYYRFAAGKVAGVECFLARTGYTGEDGVELYCRGGELERLWDALVGPGRGAPCGLGARDTLRLEAGYPLYGSDIDDTVTPFEAGLGWIVKLEKGADFVGLAALKRQRLEGVERRLLGCRGGAAKRRQRGGNEREWDQDRHSHDQRPGGHRPADRHLGRHHPRLGRRARLRRRRAQRGAGRAGPDRWEARALGRFGRGGRDPDDRGHRAHRAGRDARGDDRDPGARGARHRGGAAGRRGRGVSPGLVVAGRRGHARQDVDRQSARLHRRRAGRPGRTRRIHRPRRGAGDGREGHTLRAD